MSEEKLSKEIVIRYLLGALSVSEAEAVEARYFDDPDFLCELLAARDDLLDAGLRSELSTLEAQQLSVRLQVLPALRNQAAFAHSLQQALAQPVGGNGRAGTATASAVSKLTASAFITPRKIWFAPPRWIWTAAALCLLLGAVWVVLNLTERGRTNSSQKVAQLPLPVTSSGLPSAKQTPDLPPALTVAVTPVPPSPKAPLPVVKQSPTVSKRGASVATFVLSAGLVRTTQDAPELELAATVKTINLQLELAPPLERPQRALLQNEAGVLVWQQSPLRLQVYNGVRVAICSLPAHVLSEGPYQLRLWQASGSEAVYYFRLKKS